MRILIAALVLSLPALANPCRDDAAKLCKGVPLEGVRACLGAHLSELSPGCAGLQDKQQGAQGAGAQAKPGPGAGAMAACRADMERLCKNVEPGNGGMARCMREHAAELSSECKTIASENREKGEERLAALRAVRESCQEDMDKFCKGVPFQGGKFAACMNEHKAQLNPACLKAYGTAQEKMGGAPPRQ